MAHIELDQVGKVYPDGTRAVSGLDLEVMDGEFLVLVGPSGCGKTTALRMVAGLEPVTEGVVRIDGREVTTLPARDRDIAMVFQSYALYPHLTVFDNIAFGLSLRRTPRREIERRVHEVARVLELEPHLHRKPRTLSGGQRQRVAMGRAIVREPRAFLMDEPLSNLDAGLRVQMRAQIARIQRDLAVTTVYVTHDQTEAMTLGDRVAVMRAGVLQQVGSPDELYDRPVNLSVAGFLGSPSMNMVTGELTLDDRGGAAVQLGADRLDVPPGVLHARPALRRYADRRLAVGIRPEDMEDAAIAGVHPGAVLHSVADLVEGMGADVMVHFPVSSPAVVTEEIRVMAAETGAGPGRGDRTLLIGRFSPRTRVFEGQPLAVRVDTAALHFFDLATGAAVWS